MHTLLLGDVMYFKYHDCSIYYEIVGNGEKVIILLPGWGDTRKTFSYLTQKLSEDATIISFDYPGFGNSLFPNKNLTVYDYALIIKEFLEEHNIHHPILLGHSFGGRLSILLQGYYHYPVSKMILMDSAGIKPKKTFSSAIRNTCYKILKWFGRKLPKKFSKKYFHFLFRKFASTDYQALPENMRKTFSNIVSEDLTPYLKEIQAPTLLLWGENDTSTPLSDAKIMEREIPDCGLVSFPHSGHFSYLDYPNQMIHIIKTYIKDEF